MVPVVVPKMRFTSDRVGEPVKVGEVAKTAFPVPVSSESAVERLAEVNDPNEVALPTLVTAPVRFAFVVTVAALPDMLMPAVPADMLAAVRLVRLAPDTAPKRPDQVPVVMVPVVVILVVPTVLVDPSAIKY